MLSYSIIRKLYVFVVSINGEEKVAMYPDGRGGTAPLMYLSKEGIVEDNMRAIIQEMADKHKLYFELREYEIVNESKAETFYPSVKEYNA